MVTSTVEEAERSYDSSMTMLLEGALLALLVVWLFLRDWRATWISAIALPLSIIPTFAVMHWLGFSLNMITLLALSVVIGILVDDAIVEIENIVRHLRMGKTPLEAALEAADEIGLAVIATSMTLAAVFVPVAFMPGIAGKFFREFGWTAATAVLFSLLVARLLTPMMAAYLLKPHAEPGRANRALMHRYLGWVDAALRHRCAARCAIATGCCSSPRWRSCRCIPTTFIPSPTWAAATCSLELPPGTRLQDTVARRRAGAREALPASPSSSRSSPRSAASLDLGDPTKTGVGEVRKATLVLDWGPADDRERSQKELEREVRARLADLPGVRMSYISTEPGEQLQLVLAGDDPQRAATPPRWRSSATCARMPGPGQHHLVGLAAAPGAADRARPGARRRPRRGHRRHRRGRAHRHHRRLHASAWPSCNLPERQMPIRVGFAEAALRDPALIGLLRVPRHERRRCRCRRSPTSATAAARRMIARYQRQRNVTFTAELNGRPLGEVMTEVQTLPSVQQAAAGRAASSTPATPRCSSSCSSASRWRWSPAWSASTWCCCCCSTTRCSR